MGTYLALVLPEDYSNYSLIEEYCKFKWEKHNKLFEIKLSAKRKESEIKFCIEHGKDSLGKVYLHEQVMTRYAATEGFQKAYRNLFLIEEKTLYGSEITQVINLFRKGVKELKKRALNGLVNMEEIERYGNKERACGALKDDANSFEFGLITLCEFAFKKGFGISFR